MFVKNFTSLSPNEIVWVENNVREYLLTQGFCELSRNNDKWAFTKTEKLINIIDNFKEEGGEKCE